MKTQAKTVKELLASLPDDRRKAIEAVRKAIRKNIDKAFEEGIQYGMLGYFLPHSKYPSGYHCDPKQPLPFASVASQKNHIGLYLFCIYCDAGEQETFKKEWLATGKKLDMGKSCVRAKTLEDIPLDVVGRAFKRMTAKKFVAAYEAGLAPGAKAKAAKKATTKGAAKPAKKATKKATTKGAAKPAKKAAKKATKKATAKGAARPAKKAAKKATAKGAARPAKKAAKKATKKATKKRSRES